MRIDIVMPKMGESIQEGTILRWLKMKGERVEKDELLLEISTDKVDSEIPSPVSGILGEILVHEHETVPVGTVIAYIETTETAQRTELQQEKEVTGENQVIGKITIKPEQKERRVERKFYSPLVRAIASQANVTAAELAMIVGTGVMGRVTKKDILAYIELRSRFVSPSQGSSHSFKLLPIAKEELVKKYPPSLYRIVPMDGVQLKMAEHMSRSVATSPHVTLIDEVDVNDILVFRKEYENEFLRKHGFKLTLTPFFVFAAIEALKAYPLLNSRIEGTSIVYPAYINIGLATATEQGLLVPVLKHAQEKNFLGLTEAIYDLIVRAKEKKLSPDDMSGGTFSITNYGVFGNLIGTPIINQPQVGILGIGAVERKPVVVVDTAGNESVQIRSRAYITLTFDHRVIDGATGGGFLKKFKQTLEEFDVAQVKL